MRRWNETLVSALLVTSLFSGCKDPQKQPKQKDQSAQSKPEEKKPEPAKPQFQKALLGAFKPALPKHFTSEENPLTEEKITLGRRLYYDERLSKNHDISCNTCHLLDKYGVDQEKTSPGHK